VITCHWESGDSIVLTTNEGTEFLFTPDGAFEAFLALGKILNFDVARRYNRNGECEYTEFREPGDDLMFPFESPE